MHHFSRISLGILCFTLLLGGCSSETEKSGGGDQPSDSTQIEQPKPQVLPTNDPNARTKGIDVSSYQGNIDWPTVKASGIEFAYARATDGITFTDTEFSNNWAAMEEAGIARGAYHFFESDDDPEAQVKHFITTVGESAGDLPPMVDLEEGGIKGKIAVADYQKKVQVFMDFLEEQIGCKPIIYTNPSFANEWLNDPVLNEYPLWIAEYGVEEPTVPTNWSEQGWTLWQDTGEGQTPGIEGAVDQDVFKGNLPGFKAMGCPK